MHDDMAALREQVNADPALRALRDELSRRVAQDGDPGHDVAHALRVARWTLRLCDAPARNAIAAALLHDAVNLPKDAPDRHRASDRSAELARDLLPPLGFDHDDIIEIAEAIQDHSYSRGATPRSDLGRALQDADRLEALGALGLCRTLACGVRMGAAFFDTQDPWAGSRPLDDKAYTVDHFFTKLLLLPDTMNTAAGREEAARRATLLDQFLDQLGDEIGVVRPAGSPAASR